MSRLPHPLATLRFPLVLLLLTLSATPSSAGWVEDTVNGSIQQVGRATYSPEALSRTPEQAVQSFASQIATNSSITPQAAHDLLTDLKSLDRDRLNTVAANVSTCLIVNCRGIPGDKVASLADHLATALQDAADQDSAVWTRGVAILSVVVALFSVIVNLLLGISNRRKAKAAA